MGRLDPLEGVLSNARRRYRDNQATELAKAAELAVENDPPGARVFPDAGAGWQPR